MACITVNTVDAVARVLRYLVDDSRVVLKPLGAREWIDGRKIRAVTVYWERVPGAGLDARRLTEIALWDTGFPTIAGSHRTAPIAELPLSVTVRDKGVPGL